MERRRGPNLFDGTPGKGRGCQRNEGDFGSSIRDALAGGDATDESRVSGAFGAVLGGHVRCKSNREGVAIVVVGSPVRRIAGFARERPDRPIAGGGRGRARSTRPRTCGGLEESRPSGWTIAPQVTTLVAAHAARGTWRVGPISTRRELVRSESRFDRQLARVTEGQRGERLCSDGENRLGRARSGLERERVRTKARPSCRDARLHPTSTRIGSRAGHQPGARL